MEPLQPGDLIEVGGREGLLLTVQRKGTASH
jgi:hypothetical protein